MHFMWGDVCPHSQPCHRLLPLDLPVSIQLPDLGQFLLRLTERTFRLFLFVLQILQPIELFVHLLQGPFRKYQQRLKFVVGLITVCTGSFYSPSQIFTELCPQFFLPGYVLSTFDQLVDPEAELIYRSEPFTHLFR